MEDCWIIEPMVNSTEDTKKQRCSRHPPESNEQRWKKVCERYDKMKAEEREKKIANLKNTRGPIRDQEIRSKMMTGHACECCAPYYDSLGLSPKSRQQRINQVSRHRAWSAPVPRTPEKYWDTKFPSVEEQKRLGLYLESESPLFKQKPKRKLF